MADERLDIRLIATDHAGPVIEDLVYEDVTDPRQLRGLPGDRRLLVNGSERTIADYDGLVVPGNVPVLDVLIMLGHSVRVEKDLTSKPSVAYDGHIETNDNEGERNGQA